MSKKQRKSQRGAAMIEAIVVMTTMLVFLGVILHAAHSYGGKIDQLAATRSDVLFYASHSCTTMPTEDEDPKSTAENGMNAGGGAVATGDVSTAQADTLAPAVAAPTIVRDWNIASAARARTVEGSAIVNLEHRALSTKVTTKSWAACNEASYSNEGWKAIGEFLWNMKDDGGGFASLKSLLGS